MGSNHENERVLRREGLEPRAAESAALVLRVYFLEQVVRVLRKPMKQNHFELASQLVAEIEVFGDLEIATFGIPTSWLTGMRRHGIPFTPTQWADSHDARKKMRLIRASQQLFDLGHLHRLTRSRNDRTSHVLPAHEFLIETVQKLGTEVHRPSFYNGLRKTDWGRGMIADIQSQLNEKRIDTANTNERNR